MLRIANFLPHILNLHGDYANVGAVCRILDQAGINYVCDEINSSDLSSFHFLNYDMCLMASGEIDQFSAVKAWLESYQLVDELKEFIDQGRVLLVTGTTVAFFGHSVLREDGECECLGLLPLHARERQYVYADDLLSAIELTTPEGTKRMHLWGAQVHLVDCDFTTHDASTTPQGSVLGELLYGYGNNGRSLHEGWKLNNSFFTMMHGPVCVYNPWFTCALISYALRSKPELSDDYQRFVEASQHFDFSEEREARECFRRRLVTKEQGEASAKSPDLATTQLM